MNSFFEPFRESLVLKIFISILLFFWSIISAAQVDRKSELYKVLQSKDSIIFERTFNKCEVEKLEPIIASNFEFYHDVAGFENREEFLKSLQKNICSGSNKIQRDLVQNSLEVYPLKNNGILYGAIQKGKHIFKEKQKDKITAVGIADFTHVWVLENKEWKLKRVLSYNHKPYTL